MTVKYRVKNAINEIEKFVDDLDEEQLSLLMSICIKESKKRKKESAA